MSKPTARAPHVQIPLAYFALATVYIVVSTAAFGLYFDYEPRVLGLELAKGMGFVLVTAVILWAVLFRQLRSGELSEARFHLLVENLPDAVFLIRLPERRIVYANPAARYMFGYDDAELVGSTTERLHVDAEHFARFHDTFPRRFSTGDTFCVEFEMRRKNGEVFPTNHVISVFEEGGDTLYALSVVRDESERRAYESRISQSEERLRQIAENVREVLWITDPEKTTMHYVNPAYEFVWGRTVEELYANPRAFIEAVHPEDRRWVQEKAERQATEEYDVQYRIVRPDGDLRWIWDRAVPIRDEAGRVTRIVGIAEDITELRRREAELRQAQKMEAVGQLTGGIAHDFNNLLTVILGNAESLRESLSAADEEQQQDLKGIVAASQRGASLTQRLLAFSRQQILSRDRVDLNALVVEMTELLRRTLGEQVEIETRLASELWPITADRAQLETSIMNLAINARDAMPDGGRITLETANVSLSEEAAAPHADIGAGDYARLRVTDTGVGMPAAIAAKVFDPFFTTKEPDKGTGLGLSMVYGFVKQTGGSIEVRSVPGEGATFEILLPRRADTPAGGGGARPSPRSVPSGTETVLVVEDDPMLRAFTVSQLGTLGYTALEAGSGGEALDVLEAHPGVALVFTDVVMPGGVSGPELAVTAQQRRPGVRVLFTSGYAEIASLDDAARPGDPGMLRKPFTPRQLAEAVRRALDRPT